MSVQVVWFKRDLRVHDHAPLVAAASAGPCIFLYIAEPEILSSEEFDGSHLDFIRQSLADLDEALRELGCRLTVRSGEAVAVLERLHHETRFEALWSHEETGNRLTFDRDLRVAEWASRSSVRWTEIPQHGVVRRLGTRDGWAARWKDRMSAAIAATPARVDGVDTIDHGELPGSKSLGVVPNRKREAVPGGETVAHDVLESFLAERGVNYRADMSSPLHGWDGCSRLGPHLAWGNLSVRQVYQRTLARIEEVRELKKRREPIDSRWLQSLRSFEKRLRWHCHFIQKLEDEPELEFHNMNRAYDGLREEEFDEERFAAWREGRTGYPLVDACMRALHAGGWINFRMRAMLVSFASYHLWLHWRRPAVFLARHFLDFEPGIHYSQVQMQSGVTGINTVRIYSPIKQVLDQDPEGVFIRRYCPELAGVPSEHIAEPHKMPKGEQERVGCVIGSDYPEPIVEHREAYATARRRMYAAKSSAEAREEARAVYQKHGSRRRPRQPPRRASS